MRWWEPIEAIGATGVFVAVMYLFLRLFDWLGRGR